MRSLAVDRTGIRSRPNLFGLAVPTHVDVVVASGGGVGTTSVIEFLRAYQRTNDPGDVDGLKHLAVPPISLRPGVRFVYVYGDPVSATISLFRRDYHHAQSRKLQRFRPRAIDPIPLAMSLDEYASAGVDKLGFRRHFFNWYDRYLVHPTLFIRYETLWDNLDSLIAFFGLPESAAQRFPVKKDRMSAIDSVSEPTLRGLRKLYGPFAEELARLGDVEVRSRPAGQRARLLRYGRLYAPILADAFVRDRGGAIKNRLLEKFRRIRQAIAG